MQKGTASRTRRELDDRSTRGDNSIPKLACRSRRGADNLARRHVCPWLPAGIGGSRLRRRRPGLVLPVASTR